MKNNGTITLPIAEYKQLLRDQIILDEITFRAKTAKYFSASDIREMLGIPEKEDADE